MRGEDVRKRQEAILIVYFATACDLQAKLCAEAQGLTVHERLVRDDL